MTDAFGSPRAWAKLRAAQQARGQRALLALGQGRLPRDRDAARFWSRRTWSEFAAVPALSQVVLALVREGAPFEVQGAFSIIAADESRHAALSRALAERLGGYDEEPPAGSGFDPRSLADPSEVPVRVWALANGCFSETVSLALIRARTRATPPGVVRAVLEETLRDEALHVAAGWQLAGALLPRLPQGDRAALYDYGRAMARAIERTFGTAGLPAGPRRAERTLRARTHRLGLGSIDPDAEDAVVAAALGEVFAQLARLGVRPAKAGARRRRAAPAPRRPSSAPAR